MRASAVAESLGLPSVSIVNSGFVVLAKAAARQIGLTDPALAVFREPIINLSDEQVTELVDNVLFDQVVAGLTRTPAPPPPAAAPAAGDAAGNAAGDAVGVGPQIVMSGSLDEIQDRFYDRLWTDGLPIIPPTVDRVNAFLDAAPTEPDEILGVLKPASCELTTRNLAVNAVMAGCRPEYMPLLVAIAGCLADPEFRLEDAGSTPGWEPLAIVNGPVIEQLDLNFGPGVMRVGRRANTSIGRFMRLVMRNVAGLRIPPGENDKTSIGLGTQVVLAEDEAFLEGVGWPNFATDQGFSAGRSVVTVQSVLGVSPPVYTAGSEPLQHMETIADVIAGGQWAYTSWEGVLFRRLHPLLVISPAIATALDAGGCGKAELRAYLREHTMLPADRIVRYARHANGMEIDFPDLVARGVLPEEYARSDDPQRLVPALPWTDSIGIVVAGDHNRNQCRGFAQNHFQGPPVSREVG